MDTNLENNQVSPVENPKSNGALIGSIVIIIILIIGGIYLVKSKMERVKQADNLAAEQEKIDNSANNLSGSDEINSIEVDLQNNANIDALPEAQQ